MILIAPFHHLDTLCKPSLRRWVSSRSGLNRLANDGENRGQKDFRLLSKVIECFKVRADRSQPVGPLRGNGRTDECGNAADVCEVQEAASYIAIIVP